MANILSKTSVSDDEAQKVAKATIILDLSNADASFENTVQDTSNAVYKSADFINAQKYHEAKDDAEFYANIINDIDKAEGIYQRTNSKLKAAYDKQYQADVALAYSRATIVERVVEDPATGLTSVVKDYENLDLPAYQYEAPEALDTKTLSFDAEHQDQVVAAINDFAFNSFAELKSHYTDLQNEAQNTMAAFVPSLPKAVVVGGTVIQQKNNTPCDSLPQQAKLYLGRQFVNSTQKWQITAATFKTQLPNTPDFVPVSASYTLLDDDNNQQYSDTVFSYNQYGGSFIQIDLFTNGLTIDSPPKQLFGTVTFNNGFVLHIDFNGLGRISTVTRPVIWDCKPATPDPDPSNPDIPNRFGITRLGIADYRKVEQEICCYVPGEVSHIENIMAREYKSKSTRRRKLSEVTETLASENESEQLTDTTTTDRFEMNQEMASLVAQDQSSASSFGASYSGYGFSANANASFANNTTTEESNSQALTHAQELTERALDRVVQKVREERIEKVTEEFTEENTHGFDNRKGDSHVSGVYRWVDKIYKNQIHNYGKRLMYEFMVPEPAAFHNLAS